MQSQATELTGLTIAQAAPLIQTRKLSPAELTDAYLDRINRLDKRINAYITVTVERAREDARRATAEIGTGGYRGPLHGIPFALKDLFATAGIRTTSGSKIHADWVPDADATVVNKLREAGTVLLGKLNTHEYAYGGTTNNPHYGATHNPWNLDRIPGGSSGGSAAAIAAELAAGTLGSDTAGSIRMPAALCGVIGLKPTYGRVSAAGATPLSWSYDHVGPIARKVEDAALILQSIAGYDPADFATVRTPVDNYTAHLREGIGGLRVGVPRRFFFDGLDPDVESAVEAALATLRQLGAEVRDVDIPGVEDARNGLMRAEAQTTHAEALRNRPDDFGRDVHRALTQEVPDGLQIARQSQAARAVGVAARTILEEVDVLVTPMTAIAAPRIGEETLTFMGVEERVTQVLTRFARPFNVTYLPALSIPCGFTREGLPIGLQIAGRPFDEALVLRVAYAYEQATDWHLRRPKGLDEDRTSDG